MGAHRYCKKTKKCENYLSVAFGTDKCFSKGDVVYIENGFHQDWFKHAGSSERDDGKSVSGVVIGNDSSVYVTGFINTSPEKNPKDFEGNTVSGYGHTDIFVAKLLSDGTQDWFKVAGGSSFDDGTAVSGIVIRDDSSVYVTGVINTNPSDNPKDFNGNLISGYGNSDDIFVAKLLSDGSQDWFKVAGGSGSDEGRSVSGVVFGDDSSVYVTGSIGVDPRDNPKDFNGNPISGYGFMDIFVARLLSDGTQDWFKVAGSNNGDSSGNSVSGVVFGDDSSVYVTGFMKADPDADPKDFNGNPVSGYGNNDIFVARLLSDGFQDWFKVAGFKGGSSNDSRVSVSGVVIGDDSSVYVTGSMNIEPDNNPRDFEGNTVSGYASTFRNVFASKLLSDGTQDWFKVAGAGSGTSVSGVVIKNNSSVYVTGDIGGVRKGDEVRDFEGNLLSGYGSTDIFVSRLLSDGTQDWFKVAGGSSFDDGTAVSGIVMKNDSSVYVTGGIRADGNPKDFEGNPVSGYGARDIFVARLLLDGTQDWFKVSGGSSADGGTAVSGVVIKNDSSVYVTGGIRADGEPKDFNGNPVTVYGDSDIFVAKLGNKKIPVGIAKKNTCRCGTVKTIISGKVPDCLVDNLEPCKTYYVTQDNPPVLTTNITDNKIGLTDNRGHLFL